MQDRSHLANMNYEIRRNDYLNKIIQSPSIFLKKSQYINFISSAKSVFFKKEIYLFIYFYCKDLDISRVNFILEQKILVLFRDLVLQSLDFH